MELFSYRKINLGLHSTKRLTKINLGGDLDSISAILLDHDYYQLVQAGRTIIDNISCLKAEYIIPLKAKAYLDLSSRKEKGETVDSKNILKHMNDIIRLSQCLTPATKLENISDVVKDDMLKFLEAVQKKGNVNSVLEGKDKPSTKDIVDRLKKPYFV